MSADGFAAGTLINALWLQQCHDAPAIELRRDCPDKGEWTVIQRWPLAGGLPPRTHVLGGPRAEARAWRQYYLCEADACLARANSYITADEAKEIDMLPYYSNPGHHGPSVPAEPLGNNGCTGAGCPVPSAAADGQAPAPAAPGAQAQALADKVRHTTYADQASFEVALSEVAQAQQLNMSPDWRPIITAIWENHQNCTCQTGETRCPCVAGLSAARTGRECWCGLFMGHE